MNEFQPLGFTSFWTVGSAGKTFRVRTCSARTALEYARRRTRHPATLLALTLDVARPGPRPAYRRGATRRRKLMPDVLVRRAMGDSITSIARDLGVPRETVRDWLREVGR
ncbi:MAG: hypothetical protein HYV09_29320 [Deltaproteobacteria bacterium]|nr:hypothetical protein [Deltaproteobacteria bacterium]